MYCKYCGEQTNHCTCSEGLLGVHPDDSALVSGLISNVSDSAILGTVLGGSITGSIIGDLLGDGDLFD